MCQVEMEGPYDRVSMNDLRLGPKPLSTAKDGCVTVEQASVPVVSGVYEFGIRGSSYFRLREGRSRARTTNDLGTSHVRVLQQAPLTVTILATDP
jgi:hypothetical protein